MIRCPDCGGDMLAVVRDDVNALYECVDCGNVVIEPIFDPDGGHDDT